MKKLVLLAAVIISFQLLPGSSLAATDDETFISTAAIGGYELATTDTTAVNPALTGVERDIAIKKQIAIILNRIRQLRNMITVMNAEPNYTFRDRSNDITAEYAAPRRLQFEEDDDESLNSLGTVYTISVSDEVGDAGKFLITSAENELMLEFYDAGITEGTKLGIKSIEEDLPADVSLTHYQNDMSLDGVAFTRESGDYNGNAVFGFITARHKKGDTIYSASMPFTNMSALEDELEIFDELTTITFLYTLVKNSEVE